MPLPHCHVRFAFSALAGVVVGCMNVGLAQPAPERAAMAAFLLQLPAFFEWPDSAFGSSADPFRLCVVGEDPFGAMLEGRPEAQVVGKRALIIEREKAISPGEHCQVMYIGGEADFVAQSLAAVSGTPVLTVTDAQTGDKGIVNFVAAQDRVRLQVDQQAARRNHLNVSSKLLDLAVPPPAGSPP